MLVLGLKDMVAVVGLVGWLPEPVGAMAKRSWSFFSITRRQRCWKSSIGYLVSTQHQKYLTQSRDILVDKWGRG